MSFKSYRTESRADYGTNEDGKINREQLNCGSLMRIADATELMAKNYSDLISERDRLKLRAENEAANRRRLEHQVRGLRGAIGRLKRKALGLGPIVRNPRPQ